MLGVMFIKCCIKVADVSLLPQIKLRGKRQAIQVRSQDGTMREFGTLSQTLPHHLPSHQPPQHAGHIQTKCSIQRTILPSPTWQQNTTTYHYWTYSCSPWFRARFTRKDISPGWKEERSNMYSNQHRIIQGSHWSWLRRQERQGVHIINSRGTIMGQHVRASKCINCLPTSSSSQGHKMAQQSRSNKHKSTHQLPFHPWQLSLYCWEAQDYEQIGIRELQTSHEETNKGNLIWRRSAKKHARRR